MFGNFSVWWDGLTLFQQIYWIVAIPASLLFIIQLIMTFIGGDFEHHSIGDSANMDHDLGAGFHIFTLKNLIGFFTVFAWCGLAGIEGGLGKFLTIFLSIICGFIMMFIMAALFYGLSKLSENGSLDMKNAISKVGEVYIPIPPRKEGLGKVEIMVQGALRTLDAMTEELEEIKSKTLVEVVDVINDNILIVQRSR